MKNLLIVIILSLVFSSCSHLGMRKPASDDRPKHYIITLHGVRGNATSFGKFHDFVKMHLEDIDPTYEVKTINFVYNNGKEAYNSDLDKDLFDPDQISDLLNRRLDQEFFSPLNELKDEDKISVVAYSMGSLVGLNWYYRTLQQYDEVKNFTTDSYENKMKRDHFRYIQKVQNFIALGGATYGSFLANYGIDKNMRYIINKSTAVGDTSWGEVVALSSGSPSSYNIRQGRIKSRQQPYSDILKTEFTSIIGLFPCLSDLDQSDAGCQRDIDSIKAQLGSLSAFAFSGGVRFEADGPVQVPSANNEFLYYSDLLTPEAKAKLITAQQFKNTKMPNDKIILADVSHATLDGGEKINDVVIVPERCRIGKTCDHPNYNHELKILSGCDKPGSTCNMQKYQQYMKEYFHQSESVAQSHLNQEVHSYALELNLRIPKGGAKIPDDFRMNILKYIKFNFVDPKFVENYRKNSFLSNILKESGIIDKVWDTVAFWKDDSQKFSSTDGLLKEKGPGYLIRIARAAEMESTYSRVYEVNGETHLRINLRGQINSDGEDAQSKAAFMKARQEGVLIGLAVAIPGYKPRQAIAPIKVLYSTYLDLVMEKP